MKTSRPAGTAQEKNRIKTQMIKLCKNCLSTVVVHAWWFSAALMTGDAFGADPITSMDIRVGQAAGAVGTEIRWFPSDVTSADHYRVYCYSATGEISNSEAIPSGQEQLTLANASMSGVVEIEVRSFDPAGVEVERTVREPFGSVPPLAQAAPAAASTGLKLSLVQADSAQFPLVFVTVRAEEDGVPLNTLGKANFSVAENGRPQTDLFDVTPPQAGGGVRLADVVFLIDTSGSMGDKIAAVRDNARAFADALAASGIDYRLGLVQFGQTASSGAPRIVGGGLIADKEQFKNLVGGLVASGGTEPGFAAIRLAINSFNFRPGAQKVFLLITDEDSDDRDLAGTVNLILANQVVVHVAADCSFGTSTSDYCGAIGVRGVSGGSQFSVAGPYNAVLDTIAASVANTYIVRYRSDNPLFDGTQRNGVCTVVKDSANSAVNFSYVPGGAPVITRTPQTLLLHLLPLVAGSTPTISVTVKDNAAPFVQSVTLYARKSGGSGGFTAVPMVAQGSDIYSAALPMSQVASPGVQYYVRATDGQVTTSSPSTEPELNAYQIAVLPNYAPVVEHTPPASCAAGQPLSIAVRVTDSTLAIKALAVYHRLKGQILWSRVEKNFTTPLPTAVTETLVIPGAAVAAPGIQYYIVATDDLGIARLWPEGGADAPQECLTSSARPVVLLHGVMGSVLEDAEGDAIWPTAVAAPFGKGVEDLQFTSNGVPRTDLQATEFVKTSHPIDELQSYLGKNGIVVVPFYYDWRFSIRELANRLQTFINGDSRIGSGQVDIVAHSMGGLVAKQYIEDLGSGAGDKVRKLVCLGTPQLGAPKIFKVLRYGDGSMGFGFISEMELKRAAHNMPSAFNMIPGESYISAYPKFFEDCRSEAGAEGGPLDYIQFKDFLENAIEVINPLPATDPEPLEKLSPYLIENEYEAWQATRDALEPTAGGVEFIAIAGYGKNSVAGNVEYDPAFNGTGSLVTGATTALKGRQIEPVFETGDGTVPLLSAKGISGTIYYANMDKLGNHTKMLGKAPLHEQVHGLLTKGAGIYGQDGAKCFSTQEPEVKAAQLKVALRSPAHLSIQNSVGEKTGFLPDGLMVDDIPGAAAERFGHEEFVVVRDGDTYTVRVVGNAAGTFTLELQDMDENNQPVRTTAWIGIPTTNGAVCEIVTTVGETNRLLVVDTNLDGIPDTSVPPSEIYDSDGGRHDLVLTKTAAKPIGLVGSPLTYSIAISNAGPDAVTGTKVYDQLPPGVTLSTSSQPYVLTNGLIRMELGVLVPGQTAQVIMTCSPGLAGLLTNNAACSGNGIDISVSNNYASAEVVVVTTPCELVEALVDLVNTAGLDSQNKRPFIATLQAACAAFDRGNWIAAVNQLQAFQNKVQAQVAPEYPAIAAEWMVAAQDIIELVVGTDLKLEVKPQGKGAKLKFRGLPGKAYIVEVSGDLQTWTEIGNAADQGGGNFELDDATFMAPRFYRVITM